MKLLVFGSVTAEQYSPMRLHFLREGKKVRVVRIPDEYRDTQIFLNELWDAKEVDFDSDDEIDAAMDELMDTFCVKKFGSADLDSVVGAILPVCSADDERSEWEWITTRLGPSALLYRVEECDRVPGAFYLICRSDPDQKTLDVH